MGNDAEVDVCSRCGQPASMQCPKCLELGLPRKLSMFCNQQCFTDGWKEHKKIHKQQNDEWLYVTNRGKGRSATMPRFDWTGDLRPERVGPRRVIPEGIAKPDWAVGGIPREEINSPQQSIIRQRSAKDIEGLKKACKLARHVLDAAHAAIAPGVTTDEIDAVVHRETIQGGAYPSPLNYYHFPKSCCTSVNEVVCHGIPDKRPLVNGDIVNVDVSVFLSGYHADLNETYVVGEVDEASKHLIKATYECLEAAIAIVKPGVRFREVGDVISKVAQAAGLSVVRTYCGHGICDLFHCAPNIPHYAGNKAVGVMKEGQTFTIEPMINMGGWRDRTWPDGWTSVTEDGKRSAQFEHTLLVTKTGCEVLTGRTSSSPPLWWEVPAPQGGLPATEEQGGEAGDDGAAA